MLKCGSKFCLLQGFIAYQTPSRGDTQEAKFIKELIVGFFSFP